MNLETYITKFSHLKPNATKSVVRPHKMCMMLAVIDLIESQYITQNRIFFDKMLLDRFTYYFDQYKSPTCANSPHLPFFYLKSSEFWHLHFVPELKDFYFSKKTPSRKLIADCISYASLDIALFVLLQSSSHRTLLKQAILQNFGKFTDTAIYDTELQVTEREATYTQRVGQDKFRRKVLHYWQRCAATDFKQPEFLVASHIKPWRDANDHERIDVFNGLLLVTQIDYAFDLGYISFDKKGKILIAKQLNDHEYLGVHPHLKIRFEPQHQQYLHHHREYCYLG